MDTTPDNVTQGNAWWWGGLLLTPIRWVTGYMFLSAMLRREFYVPAKMDPTSSEYTGHKFATFIPHALGIVKPLLTYFVDHASVLLVDLEPPTPASLSHGESVTLTIIDVSGAKWSADTIVK